MLAAPDETLPRLGSKQMGGVAADLAVLVGQALQANQVETITDLSFRGTSEGVTIDPEGQKEILDGVGNGRLAHFVFDTFGQSNAGISCWVDSHNLRAGPANSRQRLARGMHGEMVNISEHTTDSKTYEPVSEEAADASTIVAMAAQVKEQAEPLDNAADSDSSPKGNSRGFKEILFDQVGIVPVLGQLLVIAGTSVHNLPEDAVVHADIYVDCGARRGLYANNTVRLWAANRKTGVDTTFKASLRPFATGKQRIAFASVIMRTNARTEEGYTSTWDLLVQHGREIKRAHREQVNGQKPGETIPFPATPDTIISMAQFVTKVAQSEVTKFE